MADKNETYSKKREEDVRVNSNVILLRARR